MSTSTLRARFITFQAAWANAGVIYIGKSDVASTKYMKALQPGQDWDIEAPQDASFALNIWYADSANNGDKVSWAAGVT